MRAISPVRFVGGVGATFPDAGGSNSSSAAEPSSNTSTPPAPGSGLPGLMALFSSASSPQHATAHAYLARVKIPPLDSSLDTEE